MATDYERLATAADAFSGGVPSEIDAALRDLKSLVREVGRAVNPADIQSSKERAADGERVLGELDRLGGSDSAAGLQLALSSAEAFVARYARGLDHR